MIVKLLELLLQLSKSDVLFGECASGTCHGHVLIDVGERWDERVQRLDWVHM